MTNSRKSGSNDQMIKKIIRLYDDEGEILFEKFNINYLVNALDRQKIQLIQKSYRSKEDGFNLVQFVRFFLNVIQHSQIETLYLAISLIQFFRQISRANSFCQKVNFSYVTNYICSKILENRNSQNHIPTKHIPIYQSIQPKYDLKEYLLQPPIIYGVHDGCNPKLSSTKILIDKNKHESVVTGCYFSISLSKLFSLDCLSDNISIYDTNCNFVRKIKPQSAKVKKNVVILSFAFSQRQQRLGAVLKDSSLIFWDNGDKFQFQKIISTASFCQQCQTNIYFLSYFNCWISTDKNGMIYEWNLHTQAPERSITCKFRQKINDLCQIGYLNLLAIAQQVGGEDKKQNNRSSSIILYNYIKGQPVAQIQMESDRRVPHTLQYSQTYQVLLSAGFEKKINIYSINPKYLDTTLSGQLLGHQSLITCFTILSKTSMVVSADDKGKVKVWDISSYKCLQTIDFKDKTIITKLLSMVQAGKIGVLGSRVNIVEFDQKHQLIKKNKKKQKLQPLYIACNHSNFELLVLTRKDLRAIDLKTGLIKHIYCQFYNIDEQISYFKYFETLRKFAIGNEKGEIKIYNVKTGKLQQELFPHSAQVTYFQYDQQNKLFISGSYDSNINIQKQKQVLRQIKNNFNQKSINVMSVSIYLGLIAVGSNQPNIYIWDYQFGKLLAQITLQQPNEQPILLQFLSGYSIIFIATSNAKIHIIKLNRKQNILQIETIWCDNYGYPATNMYCDIILKGTDQRTAPQICNLYLALISGDIIVINLMNIIKNYKITENVSSRIGFNAQRQLRQNFNNEIAKKKYIKYTILTPQNNYSLDVKTIPAHNSSITSMTIINLDQRFLVTSSLDYRVKIWKNFQQICDFNINLPLPYQWNFTIIQQNRNKDKIMLGLKIIQTIFIRFGNDISINESKMLKLNKLFQKIECDENFHITQPLIDQQIDVRLFQTQFTVRDIHYNQIKKINFRQIAGPNLKQIQLKKKIVDMQKQWNSNKAIQQQQKERLLMSIQHRVKKNEEKQQIIEFLEQTKKPIQQIKRHHSSNPSILALSQKIDNMYFKKNQVLTKNNNCKIVQKNKQRNFIDSQYSNSLLKSRFRKNPKRLTQKFQQYYQEKERCFKTSNTLSRKSIKTYQNNFNQFTNQKSFRNILSEMNNKVRNSRQNNKFKNIDILIDSQNWKTSKLMTKNNLFLSSYDNFIKNFHHHK